jgi:hypothetical protein
LYFGSPEKQLPVLAWFLGAMMVARDAVCTWASDSQARATGFSGVSCEPHFAVDLRFAD